MTIYVVSDWDAFKEAVGGCRYRLYKMYIHGNKVLIRARAGSIGFEKELDTSLEGDKKEYERIVSDLEMYGFVEVKKTLSDDEFFV